MPDSKDLIVTILGASVGLGGLLLVFSGFIFVQASSFPSTTDNRIIKKYTKAARWGIYPFLGFLVVTVLSVVWLLHPWKCLYVICVSLFLILVAGTGVYGAVVSHRYL
jgi:cell division protein FtsW (lipid II flippase)